MTAVALPLAAAGPVGWLIAGAAAVAGTIATVWAVDKAKEALDRKKAAEASSAAKVSDQAFPKTAPASRMQCEEPPPGAPDVSKAQDELEKLGPVKDMSEADIAYKLREANFDGPFQARNGGRVFLKDLSDGSTTVRIRMDDGEFWQEDDHAGKVDHLHKEAVNTRNADGTAKSMEDKIADKDDIKFDDSGCPQFPPQTKKDFAQKKKKFFKNTHIPIKNANPD